MSIRIGIGTGLGADVTARDYWRWVDYCEEAGVDSVWHSDQLLGATLEPVTMLAALAARTRRLRFGTNALVVPFRDPLVIAKKFAAIEYLSEGRLLPVFGVGATSDPYWDATGASPKGRGSRANEAIVLIRQLLEQEQVEFAGEHFRYSGPGVHPRPARPIPMWIGGNSKAAVQRTAALGDGWLGSLIGPARAGKAKREIEAALAETGRVIEPDHYGVTLFLRIGAANDPAVAAVRDRLIAGMKSLDRSVAMDAFAIGTARDVVKVIRRFVGEGMSKFVALPMAGDSEDLMEQTRRLVGEILPEIED